MAEITEKDINHAIRTCHWRKDVGGVAICSGNCNICEIEIERGRCETLKEIFKQIKEETK